MDTVRLIEDKIDKCFSNASYKLFESNRKRLYLPEFVIRNLEVRFVSVVYGVEPNRKILQYRGVDVVVGYEKCVVLVHDDYSMYGSDEMISKVEL